MTVTKLTNEQVIEIVKGIINKEMYLKEDKGYYYGEIYADYRDELDDKSIIKILEAKNPMEEFYECFDTIDAEDYEYNSVFETIEKNWDEEENGDYEDYEDFVRDWVHENVYFNYDYEHFLNQDVLVDIRIDTGDANYDYTLNNFASYNAEVNETISNESSILWLVKQQGYKKSDLNNAVRKQEFKDSKFLKSVYEECVNVTSHMNALVFLVKISLKDAIEYIEKPRKLKLTKGTTCGLYDSWSGAGGLLEIQLEKEVIIPAKYIQLFVDGSRGYGVQDIWGMSSGAWTDAIIK